MKIGRLEINQTCGLCYKNCKLKNGGCEYSTYYLSGLCTLIASIFFLFLSCIDGIVWFLKLFMVFTAFIGMLTGGGIIIYTVLKTSKIKEDVDNKKTLL